MKPPNEERLRGRARQSLAGEMKTIAAIDIGGTKIAVGSVREDGTIANRCECPTEPASGFHHAIENIRRMLRAVSDGGPQFTGIGVACPGPLDPTTGIIGDVGTLPGWQGGNLIEELQSEFAIPIAVENDADAAALAEANWGAARDSERAIYVTVSTGIGGGIVLSGKLYRGAGGSHPEIGHQVIDNSGPLCYCNVRGCWESLASGLAMVSWMREQSPNGTCATAAEICERARQGDPLARRVVEREGYYLGLGLSNLITLFMPDTIVLGGGVMKSSSLFMDIALRVVREKCTQVPAEKTHITRAFFGHDAGLLGAAYAWIYRYCRGDVAHDATGAGIAEDANCTGPTASP